MRSLKVVNSDVSDTDELGNAVEHMLRQALRIPRGGRPWGKQLDRKQRVMLDSDRSPGNRTWFAPG